ncbi:hypothetical protein AMATHDRAFT_42818 [Amanita thiersii Skay4041]|uniref:RING-CH-type domain-containing protein n=1 Tax=Amanita thiersii Skay4041 TaxID=703135 RepID=A0A2A9NIP2_9AGAR|nr:hypothetical protein AMATHDRAFT_42818 [Amanita thiersii Skay4041]
MNKRVPTVDDLRVKLCYICREEERYEDQPPADDSSTTDQTTPLAPTPAPPSTTTTTTTTTAAPTTQRQAWTHPCNCTLIAHEQCLLKWIQTSQATSSRAPNALKCPQCGAKYELESKRPVILKILAAGNRTLQQMGRLFTLFSVATFIGVMGSGVYIICTGYGAWAIRKFIGKEMFDLLLTNDPSNWSWTAFLNLPLIPLSLILSRFQTKNSGIPAIIPILLVWPPSSPVGPHQQLLRDHWTNPANASQLAALTTLGPTRSWPPPPIAFGLFFVPLVRIVYRGLYAKLAYKVLGANAASLLHGNTRRQDGEEGGEEDVHVNVAIDEEHGEGGGGGDNPQRQQQQQPQPQQQPQQQGQGGQQEENIVWQWGRIGGPLAVRIRTIREDPQRRQPNQEPLRVPMPRPPQQEQDRLEAAAREGDGEEVAPEVEAAGDNANVVAGPANQPAAAEAEAEAPPPNPNNGNDNNADNANNANQELDPNPAAVVAAEQHIEINANSLGRQIGGALLIPAISSWMGTLLLRLSRHSRLLREFLGVRLRSGVGMIHELGRIGGDGGSGSGGSGSGMPRGLFLFPPPPPPPLGPWSYKSWDGLSPWQQMKLAIRLAMGAAWGGTRTWAESDPVWWRNSIGLGLFVVAKDCLQLLHLWLTKRELETRKVKNRDFSGVDLTELDLVPSWASRA